MIDQKKRAELEQGIALMAEIYPRQWRQLFLRLTEEGFTESQSMLLLTTYISTSCQVPNG